MTRLRLLLAMALVWTLLAAGAETAAAAARAAAAPITTVDG